MKIAGILIVILGAVVCYGSGFVRKLLFPKKDEEKEASFDMKGNFIKIAGVVIAIGGVLLIMYS